MNMIKYWLTLHYIIHTYTLFIPYGKSNLNHLYICPLEACILQVNGALLCHPKMAQNHFVPPGGMTCPTQSEQQSP